MCKVKVEYKELYASGLGDSKVYTCSINNSEIHERKITKFTGKHVNKLTDDGVALVAFKKCKMSSN
jgi:hypothetical protein